MYTNLTGKYRKKYIIWNQVQWVKATLNIRVAKTKSAWFKVVGNIKKKATQKHAKPKTKSAWFYGVGIKTSRLQII